MKCERARTRAFSNCTNADAPECVQRSNAHIQAGPKTCIFKLYECGRARMCAAGQCTHSGGPENVHFQLHESGRARMCAGIDKSQQPAYGAGAAMDLETAAGRGLEIAAADGKVKAAARCSGHSD